MTTYKILIVDDERYVAHSLRSLLPWENHGYEIAGIALSAQDALAFIETTPVDIVLCDIKMPGMSGLDLIMAVRERHPDMQCIIVSGHAEFSLAQRALLCGAVAYCLKPFNESELLGALNLARERLDQAHTHKRILFQNMILTAPDLTDERISELMRDMGFDAERPIQLLAMVGKAAATISLPSGIDAEVGPEKRIALIQPPVQCPQYTDVGIGTREICSSKDFAQACEQVMLEAHQNYAPSPLEDGALDYDGYMALVDQLGSLENLRHAPDHVSERHDTPPQDKPDLISQAKAFLEKNYTSPLCIADITDELHVSASYFSSVFKKVTGENYTNYLTNLRMNAAQNLLRTTEKTIAEIAVTIGYSDYFYFAKVFKKQFGLTPTLFREGWNP